MHHQRPPKALIQIVEIVMMISCEIKVNKHTNDENKQLTCFGTKPMSTGKSERFHYSSRTPKLRGREKQFILQLYFL